MRDDDLLYVLPSTAVSVLSSVTKMVQYPLFESRENVLRSYYEGLYHITSDEAADKIIESQEVHASNRFASYGIHKRCFFFGGIPDFENVCLNVTPGQTLTAVRVKLPYERLAEFDRRGMNDGAITYKGDLSLEGATVEKVRLGLKERDGSLCYEQISEEEFQNYKLDLSEEKLKIVENKMAFKLRSFCTGLRKEFEMFKNNVGNAFNHLIHDESSYMQFLKTRQDYINENSDLFENTEELPVIKVENDQEAAIDMFKSISDVNNQSYQIGSLSTNDKNDVKAELLKGIISSTISSLNQGVSINTSNSVITPSMSDKDIADVLYTNICHGKIENCYSLLDNSTVLFSVCKTYIDSKKDEKKQNGQVDSRINFLNQEIDNYNSNLKQNSYSFN